MKIIWLKPLSYGIAFLIGFLSCLLIAVNFDNPEFPLSSNSNLGNSESPGNWVQERQIRVYDNMVVIDVEGASLSRYTSSGSMKPLLDKDSNGLRIIPESEKQIRTGDIVTFEQEGELIIHRVIEKGEDEQGIYFITKGDNNQFPDGKVRFRDIKYVTIGVLW